jgi:hypothetical protein
MIWKGYRSRLHKYNHFNVYGLFGRDRRYAEIPPRRGNGPAVKSRDENQRRGDQDEPLVRRRIKTVAEGEINNLANINMSARQTPSFSGKRAETDDESLKRKLPERRESAD